VVTHPSTNRGRRALTSLSVPLSYSIGRQVDSVVLLGHVQSFNISEQTINTLKYFPRNW